LGSSRRWQQDATAAAAVSARDSRARPTEAISGDAHRFHSCGSTRRSAPVLRQVDGVSWRQRRRRRRVAGGRQNRQQRQQFEPLGAPYKGAARPAVTRARKMQRVPIRETVLSQCEPTEAAPDSGLQQRLSVGISAASERRRVLSETISSRSKQDKQKEKELQQQEQQQQPQPSEQQQAAEADESQTSQQRPDSVAMPPPPPAVTTFAAAAGSHSPVVVEAVLEEPSPAVSATDAADVPATMNGHDASAAQISTAASVVVSATSTSIASSITTNATTSTTVAFAAAAVAAV
ncbi:hypothetical protein BOX15_Mlig007750g4, partial [Macrostomum lignano]